MSYGQSDNLFWQHSYDFIKMTQKRDRNDKKTLKPLQDYFKKGNVFFMMQILKVDTIKEKQMNTRL